MIWGIPVGNLQVMFALSALLQVVPLFLLRSLEDRQGLTPGQVLRAERQKWAQRLRRRKTS